MLKKCLAYLALSVLLAQPDATAECPCKQKNQPRQQRQKQRRQQNVQQQAPAPKPAPAPAPAPVVKPAAPVAQPKPATPAPAAKPAAPAAAPVAQTEDKVIYPKSPKELDDIVKNNALVIVNIGTEWCGPCRNFMPAYKASAKANPDIVHIKADADKLRGNKHIQGVNAYPTIKFLKNGKVVDTCQGTSQFAKLCAKLAPTETVPAGK
jgi:thiol-disulfide isomerase/thioredoxin